MRGRNRWIGGVCSGIADYYAISEILVRAVVFAMSLACGVGLMLYAVAWVLLPDSNTGRILAEDLVHGEWRAELIGVLVLFALAIWVPGVGIFAFLAAFVLLVVMVSSGGHFPKGVYPQGGGEPGPGYGRGSSAPRMAPAGNPFPYEQPGVNASDPCRAHEPGIEYPRQSYCSVPEGCSTGTSDASAAEYGGESRADETPRRSGWNQGPNRGSYGWQAPTAPPFGTTYVSTPQPAYRSRPQQARKPKRMRRRPAGPALTLGALGLVFLVAGVVVYMIVTNHMYLEGSLRLVSVAVGLTSLALGLGVVVLGVVGHRAGGLKPIVVLVAMLAVFAICADSAYAVVLHGTRGAVNGYAEEYVQGVHSIGSSRADYRKLEKGIAFQGASYDDSIVNVDLSDYATTFGTHEIKEENGNSVKSGCPTGRINLAVHNAQVYVTLPKGCSYVLTPVDEGLVSSYIRHDGYRVNLYSYKDGSRKLHVTALHKESSKHYQKDSPDDEDDDVYSDYGDGYFEDHRGLGHFGLVMGANQVGEPGARRLGSPYAASRRFYSLWKHGDDYSRGSRSLMDSFEAMPAQGPEVIITVSALAQAQVQVGYPNDIHIPERSR